MDKTNPTDILHQLLLTVKERYVLQEDTGQSNGFKALFPGEGQGVHVLRIKRKGTHLASWKTLLFIFEADQSVIPKCLTWAASVREELLNNESSDLYLFIIPKSSDKIPIENCIYIESSDQFCRKYVMRPDETFLDLVDRTFLYQDQYNAEITEISDPLIAALDKTGNSLTSFSSVEQNIWKNILLSEKSGIETLEALMKASLENNQNDQA